MKKTLLLIAVGVVATFSVTSCKKTEGCSDPDALNYNDEVKEKNDDGSCTYKSDVANAVGTYNWKVTAECTDCGSESGTGASVSESGDGIKISFPADTSLTGNTFDITGNNVAEASNGFTFDVKDGFIIDSDGITNSYVGYDAATLDGKDYNGLYEYDSNSITFGIEYDDNGNKTVIIFELTK